MIIINYAITGISSDVVPIYSIQFTINNFHHIPSSCIINGTYGEGRQHMHSLCVCMLYLNHRDELDRSILDLDSRQKRQIDVSVTGLTRQYSTVWYVARACVHEPMGAIYSAS